MGKIVKVNVRGEIKKIPGIDLMKYLVHTRRLYMGLPFWSADAFKIFKKEVEAEKFNEKELFFKWMDDFSKRKLKGESSLWVMEDLNDERALDKAYDDIKDALRR